MPAPTYTLQQTLPTCIAESATSIQETTFDQGRVKVHSSCCRTLGTSVKISAGSHNATGRTLMFEGTLSTCADTATGAKTFSSDSFRLCGASAVTAKYWDIVFPDDPDPFSGVDWAGGNLFMDIAGPSAPTLLDVGATVNITTAEDLAIGAVAIRSAIIAGWSGYSGKLTVTAIWNGGSNRRIRIAFTDPAIYPTSVSPGSDFIVNTLGGENSEPPTISGPTTGSTTTTVNAYWSLVWTNCEAGGIVAQLLNAADDSLIAEYANEYYAVKMGFKTILNRRKVTCGHPCTGLISASSVRALHPEVLCLTAVTSMNRCLGNLRDKLYTGQITSATGWVSPLSGLSASHATSLSAATGGTSAPSDASLTGTFGYSCPFPGFSPAWPTSPMSNITVAFDFTGSGDWSGSFTANPCPLSVPSGVGSSLQWGGLTLSGLPDIPCKVTISGTGVPTEMGAADRVGNASISWTGTGQISTFHDYCTGALSVTITGTIIVRGQVSIAVPAEYGSPGTQTLTFILTSSSTTSITFQISQSGTAYP